MTTGETCERELAFNALKKGGDTEKAKVYAMLAIAAEIRFLAEVLDAKADGSEAHPVHIYDGR